MVVVEQEVREANSRRWVQECTLPPIIISLSREEAINELNGKLTVAVKIQGQKLSSYAPFC